MFLFIILLSLVGSSLQCNPIGGFATPPNTCNFEYNASLGGSTCSLTVDPITIPATHGNGGWGGFFGNTDNNTNNNGWVYVQYESVNSDSYTVTTNDVLDPICHDYTTDPDGHSFNFSAGFQEAQPMIMVGCNNLVQNCLIHMNVKAFFPYQPPPTHFPSPTISPPPPPPPSPTYSSSTDNHSLWVIVCGGVLIGTLVTIIGITLVIIVCRLRATASAETEPLV